MHTSGKSYELLLLFGIVALLKSIIHFPTDYVCNFQVKKGLGGKVRLILSGAAPLSSHVEAFLRVVACSHVLQGYGICPFKLCVCFTLT